MESRKCAPIPGAGRLSTQTVTESNQLNYPLPSYYHFYSKSTAFFRNGGRLASPAHKTPSHDLEAIGKHFEIPGDFAWSIPYGSGHINDTYAATYTFQGKTRRYIHQRINHDIFKNPVALMENIARVTVHQRAKLAAAGQTDIERRALTTILCRDGLAYYKDDQGNTWRTYIFIEGASSHDSIKSPDQAKQAAKAFGEFQANLTIFPAGACTIRFRIFIIHPNGWRLCWRRWHSTHTAERRKPPWKSISCARAPRWPRSCSISMRQG